MQHTRHLAWLLVLASAHSLALQPRATDVLVIPSGRTSIAIANPSFELDSIKGAGAPVYAASGAPWGWTPRAGSTGTRGLLAPNAVASDAFYPGNTAGFHGRNVAFLWGGDSEIQQTLHETLRANTRYTLSLDSGTRASTGGAFGGYQVRLETEDGTPIGDWTGVNRNLAPAAQFATISRTFQTGPAPAGVGKRLRIAMRVATSQGYADLDNVRLSRSNAAPIARGTPINVFLVVGQSNAMGWNSDAAKLDARNRHYADAPNTNALLGYRFHGIGAPANNGSMGLLDTQGSGYNGNFDGFGPELSLGTDLAVGLGNKPVAIIKYAVGAAGLQQNFRKVGATGSKLYDPMMTHVNAMLRQLRAMGYSPRVRAFFWLQGETDALYGTSHLYEANITRFMADIRQDTASPLLQFYFTQLDPNMPTLQGKPGTLAVNAALNAVSSTNPCDIQVIRTDDIRAPFTDGIHYTADQTITIGQRWAAAFLARNL